MRLVASATAAITAAGIATTRIGRIGVTVGVIVPTVVVVRIVVRRVIVTPTSTRAGSARVAAAEGVLVVSTRSGAGDTVINVQEQSWHGTVVPFFLPTGRPGG